MKITNQPTDYSPAFCPVVYGISEVDPGSVLHVNIVDFQGKVLGRKSFRGQSDYSVNIGGYLEKETKVYPFSECLTHFYSRPERTVAAGITAGILKSDFHTFTAGVLAASPDRLLSDCPGEVTITPADTDEITVIGAGRYLTARMLLKKPGRETILRADTDEFPGVATFLLNMRDIAERTGNTLSDYTSLTVNIEADGETIGVRKYLISEAPGDSARLCWINRYGCLDFHTFRNRLGQGGSVEKERLYNTGYEVTGLSLEESLTLSTGYEPREKLLWLSGVLSSPSVWLHAGVEEFIPVDVTTSQFTIERDMPGMLDITVRKSEKTILQRY